MIRNQYLGLHGDYDSDVEAFNALRLKLQNLENEIRAAGTLAPEGSALAKNGPAYAQALMRAWQVMDPALSNHIQAGGDKRDNVLRMVKSFEELYQSRLSLYQADKVDASGQASYGIAMQEYNAAQTDLLKREEKAEFWEKVTDVNNPFSPIGILEGIKGTALLALGVGAAIILLPPLLGAMGRNRK
jgi:hypothetical protein